MTFTNMDTMEEDYLEQTKGKELDLIVCSDGEAILGIGDQGMLCHRRFIRLHLTHSLFQVSVELGSVTSSRFD